MSSEIQEYVCTVCGKTGHSSRCCKDLIMPTTAYIQEDELMNLTRLFYSYARWQYKVIKLKTTKEVIISINDALP